MVRRLVIVFAGLFLFGAISALAGNGDNVKVNAEFRFDVKEAERTESVFKDLSHEIDLWHDAALKRNGKRMRSHEKRIFDLVENDIQARDRVVFRYENEKNASVHNAVKDGQPGQRVNVNESSQIRDDVKDLRKARQLVKAKQMLYDSIKRTDTFSNRYRLLGDYLEIVKRESRLNRVELAEDASDVIKN